MCWVKTGEPCHYPAERERDSVLVSNGPIYRRLGGGPLLEPSRHSPTAKTGAGPWRPLACSQGEPDHLA